MATLNAYKTNTRVVNDGEWVDVGAEPNTFRIRTRGFTRRYRDKLNALRREAARTANRSLRPGELPFTVDNLPPNDEDRCQGIAISEEAFLDVSGLDNAGQPVSADEFRAMLCNPEEYSALIVLAIGAASRVHAGREDEAKDAEGNSEPASQAS
jgi:hypothetical protein